MQSKNGSIRLAARVGLPIAGVERSTYSERQ